MMVRMTAPETRSLQRAPLLLLSCLFALSIANLKGQEFSILFTGSSNGTIQNCYCPDARLGGLEKRAQFITSYRERNPDVLLLDNGDNFVEYLTPGVREVITGAFGLMKPDVINLGDQDIAYGTEGYFALAGQVQELGRAVTISKGPMNFSVLPLLSPSATRFYPEFVFQDYELDNGEAQVDAWLAEDPPENTFRILLSHSGLEEDKELAQGHPGIDLIVGGHSQTAMDEPAVVNGIPIVQAGGYAGYVGEIWFRVGRDGYELTKYRLHPLSQELPDHPDVMKLIDRFSESH